MCQLLCFAVSCQGLQGFGFILLLQQLAVDLQTGWIVEFEIQMVTQHIWSEPPSEVGTCLPVERELFICLSSLSLFAVRDALHCGLLYPGRSFLKHIRLPSTPVYSGEKKVCRNPAALCPHKRSWRWQQPLRDCRSTACRWKGHSGYTSRMHLPMLLDKKVAIKLVANKHGAGRFCVVCRFLRIAQHGRHNTYLRRAK